MVMPIHWQYPLGWPIEIYGGGTTAAGSAAGDTLVDTALTARFTADNQLLGAKVHVMNCTTTSLNGQIREITGYVSATGVVTFSPTYTAQVPIATTYRILAFAPTSLGSGTLTFLEGIATEPRLSESWQDELGIDFTIWTVTNPATGAAWARGAAGAYLRATSAPAANETARLVSDQRWMVAPTLYGTDTTLKSAIFEFELRLTGVGNIDNALSILGGITTAVGDNRGSADQISWILTGDQLFSLTDNGGVETTTDCSAIGVLTAWRKLRILVVPNAVRFYGDEVLLATHTTNLPDVPGWVDYFIDTEGTGAATIEVGKVKFLQSSVDLS